MKRTICLVSMLMACAGNSGDPHEVVACDAWWISAAGATQCEKACASQPMDGIDADRDLQDDSCFVTRQSLKGRCLVEFVAEHDGERGCCFPDAMTGEIKFHPCES